MFGRRRGITPAAGPPVAVISSRPLVQMRPAQLNGGTGWAPAFPMATRNMQIGRYAGQMLTQYPTMLPGVQLFCGVEGLRSNWYYPPHPVPNEQRTQQQAYLPGAQRMGRSYTGSVGLISARKNAGRVTTAQIRQSGAQAMNWARGLTGNADDAQQ